jgi:hypothetical protein
MIYMDSLPEKSKKEIHAVDVDLGSCLGYLFVNFLGRFLYFGGILLMSLKEIFGNQNFWKMCLTRLTLRILTKVMTLTYKIKSYPIKLFKILKIMVLKNTQLSVKTFLMDNLISCKLYLVK